MKCILCCSGCIDTFCSLAVAVSHISNQQYDILYTSSFLHYPGLIMCLFGSVFMVQDVLMGKYPMVSLVLTYSNLCI